MINNSKYILNRFFIYDSLNESFSQGLPNLIKLEIPADPEKFFLNIKIFIQFNIFYLIGFNILRKKIIMTFSKINIIRLRNLTKTSFLNIFFIINFVVMINSFYFRVINNIVLVRLLKLFFITII